MRYTPTLAALGAVTALVGYSAPARSSDHGDSPAVGAEPTADINDVYSWMADTNTVVLAMTLYPNAPANAQFNNAVRYVFHTSSTPTANFTPATLPAGGVDIIATFDATQKISLWVGTSEFVTGDASQAATPLASADTKVKVFAGLRADPFFFNFAGFTSTVTDVENAASSLTFTANGCPLLDAGVAGPLASQLAHSADGGAPASPFADFNALAIVVQVDKSLLTAAGPLLSVWAGTYN